MAARFYLFYFFSFSFVTILQIFLTTPYFLLLLLLLLYTNTGECGGGRIGDQLFCYSDGMIWISIEAARRDTIVHAILKNKAVRDLKANV